MPTPKLHNHAIIDWLDSTTEMNQSYCNSTLETEANRSDTGYKYPQLDQHPRHIKLRLGTTMALTEPRPTPPNLDRNLFPDGLVTSGQHNPIPTLLRPYSDFPKQITGPTVWRAEDYRDHPDRWTHIFTPAQITELDYAATTFLASGTPLTGMTKERFPLPTLAAFFADVREEILHGRGFILFRGVPVAEWGLEKSATAYMGLGAHFGYFVSQNGRGHVLGHVKDLGEDPTQKDRVRIYRTNAK